MLQSTAQQLYNWYRPVCT